MKSIKPIAIMLGLFGAGLLPCPDCGAPMIVHFWPVALIIMINNLIKKNINQEKDAQNLIPEQKNRET